MDYEYEPQVRYFRQGKPKACKKTKGAHLFVEKDSHRSFHTHRSQIGYRLCNKEDCKDLSNEFFVTYVCGLCGKKELKIEVR